MVHPALARPHTYDLMTLSLPTIQSSSLLSISFLRPRIPLWPHYFHLSSIGFFLSFDGVISDYLFLSLCSYFIPTFLGSGEGKSLDALFLLSYSDLVHHFRRFTSRSLSSCQLYLSDVRQLALGASFADGSSQVSSLVVCVSEFIFVFVNCGCILFSIACCPDSFRPLFL